MRAVAVVVVALAGCGHPAARPRAEEIHEAPPIGDAPGATCDDVYGQTAELGASELDQALAHQDCVDDAWSDEVIACVMDAPSKQAALDCGAAWDRRSALCLGLVEMIDAAPGRFARIRGARTADAFYVSTTQLPGGDCRVDDLVGVAVCKMPRTADADARDAEFARLRRKINTCLGETTWSATLAFQMVKWARSDGLQVSLRTEQGAGGYGLLVYVGDPDAFE